jgi:hypothetical protein
MDIRQFTHKNVVVIVVAITWLWKTGKAAKGKY